MMITPILLSGGSGTRLWPLSRKSYPKQFARLLGQDTLFQASAKRFSGHGFAAPMVMTHSGFRFIVTEQLASVGIDPGAILIEPEGRNTAPAVLAAALWLESTDPEGMMLIAPSDHAVPDAVAFRSAVAAGLSAAQAGQLVTFGIQPSRAETGYGYLELAEHPDNFTPHPVALRRFIEKPDGAQAAQMLASKQYLWNAGIFLASVQSILAAFRTHCPELIAPVQAAVVNGHTDLGFFRLNPNDWTHVPDISLDYAVMEAAQNLSVVPYAGSWSDLGEWDAVWRASHQDGRGVAVAGPATALDCDNTLLRSEDPTLEVVGIGLKNIIAIAMPDAVLIADTSRGQDVRLAVSALKARNAPQATTFSKDHRPWGWFETLAIGDRFQVKRIVVRPGASLSLQSHLHRSEHWIVVEGTAKVTIGDTERLVSENESVYVPLGALHRLENPGKVPMVLIEVQTGAYLGEDDIMRHADLYARV